MVEESKSVSVLQTAEALKNEGNELFRMGNYKQAISKYSKIFLYTNGLIAKSDSMAQYANGKVITEDEDFLVKELKHSANSNMAAAYLALKQYDKVIIKATLALEIKENAKVLYRRALAYIEIGDIDNAKIDLEKASQIAPNDSGIAAAFKKLAVKSDIILKKEKKKYQGFFDKLNQE